MNHVDGPPVWRPWILVVGRAGEIAAVCAAHALRWALSYLAFWRRAAGTKDASWRLTRLIEDLGPTFIKIAQVLSARPDLTSARLCAALSRLQEHVTPVSSEQAFAVIEAAFGAPVSSVFAQIDPAPVASGSIAQVHRATLADGRVVAVKLRRPDVVRRVEADFALLRGMAACVARLPGVGAVPIRELVEEMARPVCDQLDFRLEADNHRRLRGLFENTERLTIPALVDGLCTDSVLTLEFVEGLRSVVAAPLSVRERQDAALVGLRALYRMIFEAGLVHADMHPGNVFVRKWGEVVLLDMGLVAKLSDRDRTSFVEFFFGLVNNQGDECARILVEDARTLGRRFDRRAFDAAICDLVHRHARRPSRTFEITAFVAELIAIERRFDLRGSTAFMATVLAMVVFDGICKQLYPECDFQAEARGFLVVARYKFSNPRVVRPAGAPL